MYTESPGTTLWHGEQPPIPAAPLPAACDTVVAGGGLAGVWLALELCRAGRDVVLLEGGELARGGSGRHDGSLLAALPWCYATAVERLGRDTARTWRGLLELNHAWLDGELADCRSGVQYMRTGSMALARDDRERRLLEHSARLLAEDGFPAEAWTADQLLKRLGAGPFLGGLYQPEDGTLHPVELVHVLARRLLAAGGHIAEHTPLGACVPGPSGWRVSAGGVVLDCRRVVWCTGADLAHTLPELAPRLQRVRRQTLVTQRVRKVLALPGYTADGQYRWRQAERGEVLLGGPGVPGEAPDLVIHESLERFCRGSQPKLAGVGTRPGWTSTEAAGDDGLPLAGPRPGHDGQYILGGFGANTPGQAIVFGRLLARRMEEGLPDPRLEPFDPARLYHSFRRGAEENRITQAVRPGEGR